MSVCVCVCERLTGSPAGLFEEVVVTLFALLEVCLTADWRGEGPTLRCLVTPFGVVPPRLKLSEINKFYSTVKLQYIPLDRSQSGGSASIGHLKLQCLLLVFLLHRDHTQ